MEQVRDLNMEADDMQVVLSAIKFTCIFCRGRARKWDFCGKQSWE